MFEINRNNMQICVQVSFILLIYFFKNVWSRHSWNEKFKTVSSTCMSDECFAQTEFLINIINNRLNPCDDFYEYVCSNWGKKGANLLYYPEWSIDNEMGERSFFHLRAILEEPISIHDSAIIKNAKKFYSQCINLPHLGLYDNIIISSYVKGSSYFPMFHPMESNSQKKSWTEVHNYYIGLTGESALFDIILRNPEARNYEPTLCISDITSPYGLFIPNEHFSIAKLKIYGKFLAAVLGRVISSNVHKKAYSLIEKDLMDVLVFRRELYSIKLEYFMTDRRHKFITVGELETWYHGITKQCGLKSPISWIEIIKNLFRKTYTLQSIKSLVINVQNRVYFRLLTRLLSKTPEHVIVNHMHIYFIERHLIMGKYLKEMMMDVITENGQLLGIVRYLGKRWHLCISMNEIKDPLGLIYIKRYFSESTKEMADLLMRDLKSMMQLIISDSTWLDIYTKDKSKRIIKDMTTNIGYPQYYYDYPKRDDFIGGKIIEPAKIDAVYSPYSNRISISAAYLNPPMFSTEFPDAIIYGAMGMNIAHEMYHAFELTYVEKRELEYHWSQNMLQTYQKKAECFVKQFDGLPVKELNDIKPVPRINGSSTVHENVADTMGLKLAYELFRKKLWITKNCETLPNLPGISCLKLFFISFAMSFCATFTPDGMMEYIETGKYPSPRLRVNGAVSNMKEFSKVFQCSEEAPLNPQKKCNVWI